MAVVRAACHESPARRGRRQPGLEDIAERLSERFETRCRVDLGRQKGKIVVEFASLDDLQRILALMDPGSTSTARSS